MMSNKVLIFGTSVDDTPFFVRLPFLPLCLFFAAVRVDVLLEGADVREGFTSLMKYWSIDSTHILPRAYLRTNNACDTQLILLYT